MKRRRGKQQGVFSPGGGGGGGGPMRDSQIIESFPLPPCPSAVGGGKNKAGMMITFHFPYFSPPPSSSFANMDRLSRHRHRPSSWLWYRAATDRIEGGRRHRPRGQRRGGGERERLSSFTCLLRREGGGKRKEERLFPFSLRNSWLRGGKSAALLGWREARPPPASLP